jgi:hypothetical protein
VVLVLLVSLIEEGMGKNLSVVGPRSQRPEPAITQSPVRRYATNTYQVHCTSKVRRTLTHLDDLDSYGFTWKVNSRPGGHPDIFHLGGFMQELVPGALLRIEPVALDAVVDPGAFHVGG